MKLISFSVYGQHPMYRQGIIRNAQLIKQVYPGWTMRVYCDSSFPQQERLKRLGAQVVDMGLARAHTGMLWRFLPAWEKGVERVLFRDADSRINVREAAAVREWEDMELELNLSAHCLHDHDHHRCYPIFGGMWGILGGVLSKPVLHRLRRMIRTHKLKRVDDMKFLQRYVFPEIQDSTLRHSSVDVKWESVPFPDHEECEWFVGEKVET